MKNGENVYSRRDFIRRTAAGAAGLAAAAGFKRADAGTAAHPQTLSRVVVVRDEASLSGSVMQQNVIQIMMDEGIKRLTDVADAGDAWKSLFPGITRDSVIGVKINCLFSRMSTHPPVTAAVVDGIRRMTVGGSPFPENNIVVWDWQTGQLTAAGYKINKGATGVRCMSTSSYYSDETFQVDKSPAQKLSKFITQECQYLVNVSVLKNHFMSGVSLSMKNHYGSVSNPGALQHDSGGTGSIPSINLLAPILSRQVVVICDAIFGVISGGPDNSPQVSPKSILLSRDPVAMDATGAKMLEANGCKTAKLTGSARHITVASQPPYSLGTCDPNQIETVNIENPSSTTGLDFGRRTDAAPAGFSLTPNYPNPFNAQTVIEYRLDRPAWVKLQVFDARGVYVRMLEEGMRDAGSHRAAWDGLTTYGRPVPSGTYLARLECGNRMRTVRMQLVR
jgi:uncharacterized protein (DUF362 family)